MTSTRCCTRSCSQTRVPACGLKRHARTKKTILIGRALVLCFILNPAATRAATFFVDSTADAVDAVPGNGVCTTAAGTCTLRAAIDETNALAGADTINVPAGIYVLTMGSLAITDSLDLTGAGAANTVIDGNGLTTVLVTAANAVSLTAVTIRNGDAGNVGGGIANSGTLDLINCSVEDNMAFNVGGGIYNDGGTLTLTGCTISNNTALNVGGGIHNEGTATLTNCTITGNHAGNTSGGIGNEGTAILNNCTIAANSCGNVGGGLDNDFSGSPVALLRNTLLAGNADGRGPNDCIGTLTSQGYNFVQSTTGCTISGDATGNITGANPNLGPLQDNGGPTLTHALLAGSLAIDAGNPAVPGSGGNACEATDQRGAVRPAGARCDIGAYEAEPPSCGNGAVEAGEQCDDGNMANGDGCSRTCQIEGCYTCAGQPSVCTPVVCTASDHCHDPGACDSSTGLCSNPAKPDGSVCDDGDACTIADACVSGVCSGSCGGESQHGQYTRCVRGATGLLSREERRTIRRAAAQSTCGREDKTRCCLSIRGASTCKIHFPSRCAKRGGTDIGDGSCVPDPCSAP